MERRSQREVRLGCCRWSSRARREETCTNTVVERLDADGKDVSDFDLHLRRKLPVVDESELIDPDPLSCFRLGILVGCQNGGKANDS